jgi:hypothetical protein
MQRLEDHRRRRQVERSGEGPKVEPHAFVALRSCAVDGAVEELMRAKPGDERARDIATRERRGHRMSQRPRRVVRELRRDARHREASERLARGRHVPSFAQRVGVRRPKDRVLGVEEGVLRREEPVAASRHDPLAEAEARDDAKRSCALGRGWPGLRRVGHGASGAWAAIVAAGEPRLRRTLLK